MDRQLLGRKRWQLKTEERGVEVSTVQLLTKGPDNEEYETALFFKEAQSYAVVSIESYMTEREAAQGHSKWMCMVKHHTAAELYAMLYDPDKDWSEEF